MVPLRLNGGARRASQGLAKKLLGAQRGSSCQARGERNLWAQAAELLAFFRAKR